ncbi:hypothetical protein F4557_004175 [Actinomadura catellatispora]|uniref:Uncharacterized protein n=1 Tax=Actinomadura livida TaxID=79909 RepID=A0A7W7IEU5_9ACTN|nr:hypothetical protein [Actinomadura catellatispora]
MAAAGTGAGAEVVVFREMAVNLPGGRRGRRRLLW